MLLIDFFLSFGLALILVSLLCGLFARRGPGPLSGMLFFFMIFFLTIWAGGRWLNPVESSVLSFYWITFLMIGLFDLLLIAALVPSSKLEAKRVEEVEPGVVVETEEELADVPARTAAPMIGFTFFFWFLMVFLAGALIYHYTTVA